MTDTIKNLEGLGFTNYESRVFCALFKGHSLTATEIAKSAGIARSSAYDILKSFTEKGICNEILTSSVARYEIVDPKVVEDKIQKEIHDTYKNKINKLKDSFDKLTPIFKSKSMEGQKVDVELIKGFNKHRQAKFMELWKSSSIELLLMTKLEGYVGKSVDEHTDNFLKNGGKVRTIYEAKSDFKINVDGQWKEINKDELADFCNSLAATGEEVKLSEKINQNMAIFDRKVVFISLVDPTISKYNRSDIILKNEAYAQSMADYFDTCWKNSLMPGEFKNKIKN